MTYSLPTEMGIRNNNSVLRLRTAQPERRPLRGLPQSRLCEAAYLGHNSQIHEYRRAIADMPLFTDAFCAIARGTLISCETGPIAVEDLLPGDRVCTVDNGPQTLLWIGSMSVSAQGGNNPNNSTTLSRITADSFGLGRPMPDLMLGSSARLLRRDPSLIAALGTKAALAPVTAFIDGETVLEITPVTTTRVYHLLFSNHQIIRANGLEIESYHPGKDVRTSLSQEALPLFLDMFPHITSLGHFGSTAYPRLSKNDTLEVLAA
ncbi:MAG TPA: hypothetical protein DD729_07715 [Rhodobacteraceae bacterium]|jgi:hypothetical protein|nr:hypothetical protein [Paracoccaceae bacterium]